LVISNEKLLQFVGQYRGSQSNTLAKVLLEKGQLQIQIDGKKHPLFASAELQFYQEGEFLNANFNSAMDPQKMTIKNFFGIKDFLRIE
jgi:hypothetical protein